MLIFRPAVVLILFSLITFSAGTSFGAPVQPSPDLQAYQSSSNAYYWGNRKPFPSYWQQDVHYTITAAVNDNDESIQGKEKLIYWNNSPKEITQLYFHLYQNAFTPNSYLSDMRKNDKEKSVYGEHEAKGLGTSIQSVSINGESNAWTIDNTILIVDLKEPLKPNSGMEIQIEFWTYWDKDDAGNIRRRMKSFRHGGTDDREFLHLDGVHWYPRIAVFDRKFGWTTDQHLGKEFYGDYGVYDVTLNFPSEYIVEATGELQNESEVYPGDLRQRLDISNYKTSRDVYTNPVPRDGTRKSWHFKAVNVHDFAFTADPTYRIGEVVWNGIRCIALAQEEHAHNWQPTAQFVADVVRTYSEDVGMFGYPKMIAADARDGMEYPMLTLNSGNWPGHRYVIAHEVGHNWFFGMVGNNETYRASLDEGFTQFLTALSLKKIMSVQGLPNGTDDGVVYNGYINHAIHDNTASLNIHSDYFNSAVRHGGGYGQVYYKTATMLYQLEYILGDKLFSDAFKHYFDQWKFCHPYWEDFRSSMIDYTGVDLNQFFDQWIEGTTTIDYKVGQVKHLKGNQYEITLHRKGASMPLDVRVTAKDGSVHEYYIPNSYFKKQTTAAVLPNWIGWDLIKPEYSMIVAIPGGIKNVEIDPSGRMADINRLNNSKKMPIEWRFNVGKYSPSSFRTYVMNYGPSIWYNDVDGIKAGARLAGNFYNTDHLFNLGVWYNTGIGSKPNADPSNPDLVSYSVQYSKKFKSYNRLTLDSRYLDGWTYNSVGLTREAGKGYLSLHTSARQRRNAEYLVYPEFANKSGLWETRIELSFLRYIKTMNGNGSWNLRTYSTSLQSDYAYAAGSAEWKFNRNLHKAGLHLRWFGQWMSGVSIAPESMLLLGGANTSDLMDNMYVRSYGFVDKPIQHNRDGAHFQQGGGLNIRGYSGVAITNVQDNDTFTIYSGTRGTSFSAELDFGRYLQFKVPRWLRNGPKIHPYAFADAGILGNSDNQWSGLRMDAGIGAVVSLDMFRVGGYTPMNLRFDMPFFLNRIPEEQSNYVAYRYVVGINRTF
ncbi:MAG: M1 family metallopeptidase [Bacteroidetes bacterium]|nr:M1 family metallopeptidase [Bacteroidota bacterium]